MVGVAIDVFITEMNSLTSLRTERLIYTEDQQHCAKRDKNLLICISVFSLRRPKRGLVPSRLRTLSE